MNFFWQKIKPVTVIRMLRYLVGAFNYRSIEHFNRRFFELEFCFQNIISGIFIFSDRLNPPELTNIKYFSEISRCIS